MLNKHVLGDTKQGRLHELQTHRYTQTSDTQRHTHTHRNTHPQAHTQTQTHAHRHTHSDTHKHTHMHNQTHTETRTDHLRGTEDDIVCGQEGLGAS